MVRIPAELDPGPSAGQAVAFLFRSWLEYVEGEEAANTYLDKDVLDDHGVPSH